ncbi:hypothetical protein EVC30_055 [Rhizobium phage RHph_Y1_11]|nr:hypothetical protein EVC30_055 [Rhizobium phage RHph_Y1_11]
MSRDLSKQEFNIIIAALRLWQRSSVIDDDLLAVACDGEDTCLPDHMIDDLVEELNSCQDVILTWEGDKIPDTTETLPTASTEPTKVDPDWKETSRLLLQLADRAVKTTAEQSKMLYELQGYKDELMKIAATLGEPDDPMAAWEVLEMQQGELESLRTWIVLSPEERANQGKLEVTKNFAQRWWAHGQQDDRHGVDFETRWAREQILASKQDARRERLKEKAQS